MKWSQPHCGRWLYGDADGRWLIVQFPDGTEPPETLDGLPRLATLLQFFRDVIARLDDVDPRPRGAAARLAVWLGIDKTVFSAELLRGSTPELSSGTWAALVRFFHDGDDGLFPAGPRIGYRPPPDDAVKRLVEVAAELRAERIRQGRTQAEVGAAAGFPNNAERRIYMYEAGIHRPPAGPLRQWAAALGRLDLLDDEPAVTP